MELSNDYLTLKLCRLKGAEEMDLAGGGLVVRHSQTRGGGMPMPDGSPPACVRGRLRWSTAILGSKSGFGTAGKWFSGSLCAEIEHLYPLFAGP